MAAEVPLEVPGLLQPAGEGVADPGPAGGLAGGSRGVEKGVRLRPEPVIYGSLLLNSRADAAGYGYELVAEVKLLSDWQGVGHDAEGKVAKVFR